MSTAAQPAASQPGTTTDAGAQHPGMFIPLSWPVRVVLTLVSGLSVWPLMRLDAGLFLSGGAFGLLVLVPFVEARSARLLRALALVAGAALVHYGAFRLAVSLNSHVVRVAVYAIPGLAGALVCALLTAAAAPLRSIWKGVALGSLGGLAGGVVFGVTGGSDLWVSGDYVLWQLLVFLGISSGAGRSPWAGRDTAAAK